MSEGWAEVVAEHHVEESAVQRSARLARQAAEREDREAAQAEIDRAAAIEDERDRRLFQYQQLGIGGRSVDDLAADATRAAEEDDAYTNALATIEKIDRRRASRAQAQRFQAEQMEAVSRSAVPADPLAAAQRRAHEAFRATTRARMNEAVTGQPVSRPKDVVRSRGAAVRSESCVHCIDQGVSDETSYLLHSDPELNVPVTAPGQLPGAEPTHRSGTGHGPMIYR